MIKAQYKKGTCNKFVTEKNEYCLEIIKWQRNFAGKLDHMKWNVALIP